MDPSAIPECPHFRLNVARQPDTTNLPCPINLFKLATTIYHHSRLLCQSKLVVANVAKRGRVCEMSGTESFGSPVLHPSSIVSFAGRRFVGAHLLCPFMDASFSHFRFATNVSGTPPVGKSSRRVNAIASLFLFKIPEYASFIGWLPLPESTSV